MYKMVVDFQGSIYIYIYSVLPHVHLKYTLHKTNISLCFLALFWVDDDFTNGFRWVGYGLLSCGVVDCVSPIGNIQMGLGLKHIYIHLRDLVGLMSTKIR